VIKWMAITFGAGMALILIEVIVASKKKEGFTPTDRQRCFGIFWVTVVLTGLVGFLIHSTGD
jgi:hypothetical protein